MEKLLTKAEVCELLGVSVPTLSRIVSDGAMPVYKIRGQLRFAESDVAAYIKGCREQRTKAEKPKPVKMSKLCPELPARYIPGMKVVS